MCDCRTCIYAERMEDKEPCCDCSAGGYREGENYYIKDTDCTQADLEETFDKEHIAHCLKNSANMHYHLSKNPIGMRPLYQYWAKTGTVNGPSGQKHFKCGLKFLVSLIKEYEGKDENYFF